MEQPVIRYTHNAYGVVFGFGSDVAFSSPLSFQRRNRSLEQEKWEMQQQKQKQLQKQLKLK